MWLWLGTALNNGSLLVYSGMHAYVLLSKQRFRIMTVTVCCSEQLCHLSLGYTTGAPVVCCCRCGVLWVGSMHGVHHVCWPFGGTGLEQL